MPIDRKSWNPPFRRFPKWKCPTCFHGYLVMIKDSLAIKETGPSHAAQAHDAWDPDWIRKRFSGLMQCNNEDCNEISGVSGRSEVKTIEDWDEISQDIVEEYVDLFFPEYINPAPPMFDVPDRCPEEIRSCIKQASEMVWVDLESSLNKLRIAAETLLTQQKIPKYHPQQNGKQRRQINLHSRIDLFKLKNSEAAECLMAVKWLGNHASHSGSKLTLEDVLEAADLFSHVMDILYGTKKQTIKNAQKINKKKGP